MLRITRSDTAKGIRKDPQFIVSFNALLWIHHVRISREVFSLNWRLRSSHAWYRSRSQWLYITGAKSMTVRRETAWELWDSSGRSKLQLHVGGGLEEAYDSELQFPLGCHATATRQEHHQVNQSNVTSKFKQDLRMLKPLSAPIKPDRSWVSLPTHNQRGEHQARKNNLCSPRTRRRLQ